MLITNRLDECATFYAALVGTAPERGAGWANFALPGGAMLALHTPWSPALTAEGGSTVALLDVDSLDAESQRLSGSGIVLGEPHDIPGGRVATTSDPDGRLVQLIERR
jgi:predicted enzyme related to lactoylglutathione lyase